MPKATDTCVIAGIIAATGLPVVAAIDLGDLGRGAATARLLGPAYPDSLAAAAQARLQQALGPDTVLHATGADGFAFGLADNPDAGQRLGALVEHLSGGLQVGGLPGVLAPAGGLARLGSGAAPAEALHAAIAAAVAARAAGQTWREATAADGAAHARLATILSGLACDAPSQFTLAYQPRIALPGRRCVGAEALLRWPHPALGTVPPNEFVPLAEQVGLAGMVADQVMARALADLAAWAGRGLTHTVSINISPHNLEEPGFPARLRRAVAAAGADPARLEIEITEGSLLRDGPRLRATIAEIRAAGVRIALDDFGTGYCNLQYLRDLRFDTVKIDQSFVRTLRDGDRSATIVQAAIGLAHALGCRVVAEGVEEEADLLLLAAWGCDEAQGYHIARPMPGAALAEWIAAHGGG